MGTTQVVSGHTPEPWHWESGPPPAETSGDWVTVLGPQSRGWAHITVNDWGASTAKANADRIVACVNACEGINPDAVPDLLEACVSALAIADESLDEEEKAIWADAIGHLPDLFRNAIAKATGGAS